MYSCSVFFFSLFVFSLFDCSSTAWKDERIIIQTTAARCSSSTELIKASAVYAGRISSQHKLECEIEASAVSLTWDLSMYQSIHPSIHPSIQVQIQTPNQIVQLVTVILFITVSCMKTAWLAIFSCNIWQATLSIYLWIRKWCHAVLRDFLIKTVTSLFSLLKWLTGAASCVWTKKLGKNCS